MGSSLEWRRWQTQDVILFICLLCLSLIWLLPFVTVLLSSVRGQGTC